MNAVEMGNAVRALTTDLILSDDAPSEEFRVLMKPNFDTACWSYLPPHRIYIGDQCLSRAKEGLSIDDKIQYLQRFLRHEVCHLKKTEKNLKLATAALKQAKVPFSLWNLFEDARIEHWDRERTGLKFDWAKFEMVDAPEAGSFGPPLKEFFLLIQLENECREARNPEVVEFYDRAIAAETSLALIPILAEWVARFGEEAPQSRFSSELTVASELQANPSFQAEFDEGTFKPGSMPPEKSEPVTIAERKKSRLLSEENAGVDFSLAEKLAVKFLALFGTRTVSSRSEEPSARVSARHLELDRPCYSRKTTVKASAKDLCLVIDCSGSMDGPPIEDARVLAAALSHLATLGKIRGCIVLSAVAGRTAVNEVFELPVARDVIERIHAFGDAEGLNAAILANVKRLALADMVFVKTDGHIEDEPLDRRKVERQGITVCGLYSGGVENTGDMADHFKRFYVRNSLESLIDALLQSRMM